MNGYVYAIGVPKQFVKIGFTKLPYRRLAELQIISPDRLILFGAFPSDGIEESMLHERFKHYNIRGELFRIIGIVEMFVESISKLPKPPINITSGSGNLSKKVPLAPVRASKKKMVDSAIGSEIKVTRRDLGETQAIFGERFGVDQATIHRWETKGPPVQGAAAVLIAERLAELKKRKAELKARGRS